MHSIDLGKLNGFREIYKREVENWQCEEDGSSSATDEEADSEDEDMDDDIPAGVALQPSEIPVKTDEALAIGEPMDVEEDDQPEFSAADTRPHPRAFESLRDFFSRTSQEWQNVVLEKAQYTGTTVTKSIKELRTTAFDMAESKWWDCREEITTEEERQEEAGIGEVVSIGDRTDGTGGGKRR